MYADRDGIWQQLDVMHQQPCTYYENRIKTTAGERNTHIKNLSLVER